MPDIKLIIGNKNYSSWSLRPWIFMREKGIPFEEHRVPLFEDSTRRELASYFSNGKVPVLVDGDLVVWDSLAILEYLADRFPEKGAWPEDPRARARARAVSAEMHSSFTGLRSGSPMNCRRKYPGFQHGPAALADIDRIKTLWRFCREIHGTGGPWLFGGYSIADAMYAPVVIRFVGYDVPLDGVERDYVDTVLASDHMGDWIAAATAETEVLDCEEL